MKYFTTSILLTLYTSCFSQNISQAEAYKILDKAISKSKQLESTEGNIVRKFSVKLKKKFKYDFVSEYLVLHDLERISSKQEFHRKRGGSFHYYKSFVYSYKSDLQLEDEVNRTLSIARIKELSKLYPKELKLLTNRAIDIVKTMQSDSLFSHVLYYLNLLESNPENVFTSKHTGKREMKEYLIKNLKFNLENGRYSLSKTKNYCNQIESMDLSKYKIENITDAIKDKTYSRIVNREIIDSLKKFIHLFPNFEKNDAIKEFLAVYSNPVGKYLIDNKSSMTGYLELKPGLKVTAEAQKKGFDVPDGILIYEIHDNRFLRFIYDNDTTKIVRMLKKKRGVWEFEYPYTKTLNSYTLNFMNVDVELKNSSVFRSHTLGYFKSKQYLVSPKSFFDLSKLTIIDNKIYNVSSNNGCFVQYRIASNLEWSGECNQLNFATGKGTITVKKSNIFKNIIYENFTGSFKQGIRDGYGCYSNSLNDGDCGTWEKGIRIDK